MNRFVLADGTTVDGALSQLQLTGAVVKAAGADLLDRMKNGTATPSEAGEHPQRIPHVARHCITTADGVDHRRAARDAGGNRRAVRCCGRTTRFSTDA